MDAAHVPAISACNAVYTPLVTIIGGISPPYLQNPRSPSREVRTTNDFHDVFIRR